MGTWKKYMLGIVCLWSLQAFGQCGFTAEMWSAPERINQLVDDQDQMLLATDMGIFVLDKEATKVTDHWTKISVGLPSNQVEAVAIETETNRIYIGTYDIGVSIRQSDGSWQSLPYPDEIYNGFNNVLTYCMAFDPQGRLWVGTSEGLLRYENESWEIINLQEFAPFFQTAWQMEKALDGEIIIAGNIALKTAGDHLEVFTPLPNDQFLGLFSYGDATLFQLSNGDVWYLTDVGQAGFFNGEDWTIYESFSEDIDFYFPQTEFIFEEDDGSTWFYGGEQQGYLKYTEGDWSYPTDWKGYQAPEQIFRAVDEELIIQRDSIFWLGVSAPVISEIANYPSKTPLGNLKTDAQGDVWAHDYKGSLYNLNENTKLNISPDQTILFSDFVWTSEGTCWLQSYQSILYWEAGELSIYNTETAGFPTEDLFSVLVVDGQDRPWAFHRNDKSWYTFTEGEWKTVPVLNGAYAYYATPTANGVIFLTYTNSTFQLWMVDDAGIQSIPLPSFFSINGILNAHYDQTEKTLYLIGVNEQMAQWKEGEWSGINLPEEMDIEDGFWHLTKSAGGFAAIGRHQLLWGMPENWCYYNQANGPFASERLQSVAIDGDGAIWLSHHSARVLEKITPELVLGHQTIEQERPMLAYLQANLASDFTQLVLAPEVIPEETSVHIFDINGRLVQQVVVVNQETQLSLQSLAAGMYFVKLQFADKVQSLRLCKF